ncbi:MAG: alpha/beta hydrolase [Bacillota bacterium]
MSLLKSTITIYENYINKKFNFIRLKPAYVVAKHSIIYNSNDAKVCKLSIYNNKIGSLRGVIINIHGGALISSSANARRGFCNYLASKGYSVVNLNYGLAPKYNIKDQLSHCNSALQWLADNAKEWGIPLDNIHIVGDGVGAWFARNMVHLGANPTVRNLICVKSHPLKFKSVAYFCGAFDLSNIVDKGKNPHLHNTIQRTLKASLSVNGTVQDSILDATKLQPDYLLPTYILHSVNDITPSYQSTKLVNQLTEFGTPLWEFNAVKIHAEHNFHLNTNNNYSNRARLSYIRFLNETTADQQHSRYIEV